METVMASGVLRALQSCLGWGSVCGCSGQVCTVATLKAGERMHGGTVEAGYYQSGGDHSAGLCARWLGRRAADGPGLVNAVRRHLGGGCRNLSAQGLYDSCPKRGSIDTMPPVPGCLVFAWNANRRRVGHVGVYTGNGWVIHAAGVRQGVIKAKLRGWSHWGLPGWMEYDLPQEEGGAPVLPGDADYPAECGGPLPGDPPWPSDLPPQIGYGSVGDAVRLAQQALIRAGASPATLSNGIFGPETRAALRAFQRARGLADDGIAGRETWAALLREMKPPVEEGVPATVCWGSRGAAVARLQKALNDAGAGKPVAVNGVFGAGLLSAVMAFQQANGLCADGVAGPETWERLLSKDH